MNAPDKRAAACGPLTREAVLRVMPALRNLFRLLGCDTTSFTDAGIADAVLAVSPVFQESWPTDAQVKAASIVCKSIPDLAAV
jgi:hypothetical protein